MILSLPSRLSFPKSLTEMWKIYHFCFFIIVQMLCVLPLRKRALWTLTEESTNLLTIKKSSQTMPRSHKTPHTYFEEYYFLILYQPNTSFNFSMAEFHLEEYIFYFGESPNSHSAPQLPQQKPWNFYLLLLLSLLSHKVLFISLL